MIDLQHISIILGLGLALALLLGYLIHYFHVPKVTGYLVLGILLGPFGIGLIAHEDIEHLRFISEIALGLIVFSIGGEFKVSRFRKMGHRILVVSLLEISLTVIGITILVLCLGQGLSFAVLLGIIGIATAPAATLLVLREFDSEGPVTNHILILVGMNNLICLVLFRLVFPLVKTANDPTAAFSAQEAVIWPFCEIFGSLAVGLILGVLVVLGERRLQRKNELLTLFLQQLLLVSGSAFCSGSLPS